MRFIIPLGKGSFHQDIEIYYTLRGISKHHPSADVTIIGEKPVWFKGEHIPFKENPLMCKEARIFSKICEAANRYDEFIFTNDDHFLIQPFDGRNYAQHDLQHFDGLLYGGPYKNCIQHTLKITGNIPYYDVHCPIVMKREHIETMKQYDWSQRNTFLVKSLYAYTAGLVHTDFIDRKIDAAWDVSELQTMLAGRWVFTTAETLYAPMIKFLRQLYPEKSRWE